ncbi:hypothetical protein QQP08_022188 [Theobroma cacao]|nr:hypothetical protein QQP08_022188 [Theobroma cacao]
MYHNHRLQQAIEELQNENPNINFNIKSIRKACCGIGGDYNFSLIKICGVFGVPTCSNPDKSLGSHLTQQAYKFMARWLIHDIYPKLECNFST